MKLARLETTPVVYGNSAIQTRRFSFSEGKGFSLHWHERLEFISLKKGSLEYVCGAQRGVLSPGEVLVVLPRTPHCGKALSACEYDVLAFDVRSFYNQTKSCEKTLTALFENRVLLAPCRTDPEIARCVDELCRRISPDSLLAVSQVYRLLYLLTESCGAVILEENKGRELFQIVELLEKNYARRITREELERVSGYSYVHLCRRFKKEIGLTPMNYLKVHRLETALRMIENGEGTVASVSEACGYDDANYFTRAFRGHFGHPPSYYIRKKLLRESRKKPFE
ncbi:MAG: helix-turn-helix transcriptional regulator [Clostridia bacterium]|nr:helix-turn-helix transcriptional regulator [Clostridia bacterium]